jgi:ribonuclease HI
VIVTDSAVVADELSGRRPVRAPRLRALFDDVRDARAGISEVSVRRVPRAHNAAADALARLGRERVTRP